MTGFGHNIGQIRKGKWVDTKKGFLRIDVFSVLTPFLRRGLFLFCSLLCIDAFFVSAFFRIGPLCVLTPCCVWTPFLYQGFFALLPSAFRVFLYRTAFCIELLLVSFTSLRVRPIFWPRPCVFLDFYKKTAAGSSATFGATPLKTKNRPDSGRKLRRKKKLSLRGTYHFL